MRRALAATLATALVLASLLSVTVAPVAGYIEQQLIQIKLSAPNVVKCNRSATISARVVTAEDGKPIANNTDRKSGHCLLTPPTPESPGHVWAIDNGLTFSADFKLRTVIWEFGGERLTDRLLAAVRSVHERVPLDVATLLAEQEVEAIERRAGWLLTEGRFPTDPSGRRYPWPLV